MLRVVQYIHIGLSRLQIDQLEVNSGLNKIGGRTVARSHGRQGRVKADARCATMLQNFEKLQCKLFEVQS